MVTDVGLEQAMSHQWDILPATVCIICFVQYVLYSMYIIKYVHFVFNINHNNVDLYCATPGNE